MLGAVDPKTVSSIEMVGVEGKLKFAAAPVGTTVVLPQLPADSTLQWAWVVRVEPSRVPAREWATRV